MEEPVFALKGYYNISGKIQLSMAMTKSAANPVYDEVECQHCTGDGCCFCDTLGHVFAKHPARKCKYCEGIGCFYCGYTGWSDLKGKYE